MRCLDLFCGCGTFSKPFENLIDEGYAIDNWKGCEKTFKENHPKFEFILRDIRDLNPKEFKGIRNHALPIEEEYSHEEYMEKLRKELDLYKK